MDLLIIGGSTHGLTALAVAQRTSKYSSIHFCDDKKPTELHSSIKSRYWGIIDDIKYITQNPPDIFIAIGNNHHRHQITVRLQKLGYDRPISKLIDPQAVLMGDIEIGNGTLIMPGSVICPETRLGEATIVGAHSFIGACCTIGSYSNICPAASIGGAASIGKGTYIGMGARILQELSIANNTTIGAGAVVANSISRAGIFTGIPARELASES